MNVLMLFKFLLMFFVLSTSVIAENTIQDNSAFTLLHEYAIGANFKSDSVSSEPNDFIACKIKNETFGNRCDTIKIYSPFISEHHPKSIEKELFCSGSASGYGALTCEAVNGITAPTWDFSNKETRTLDYAISLQMLNAHPDLMFNQKMMKMDLLYFIPYYEDDDSYFVLTWCPRKKVSNSIKTEKCVILLPTESYSQTRIGIIVSPLFSFQVEDNSVYLTGKVGNIHLLFHFSFEITDKKGNCWILAWKKIKKQHLPVKP